MENFEKCTVAMLGGPCSQHVTGNTSRQNQPQSAIMTNSSFSMLSDRCMGITYCKLRTSGNTLRTSLFHFQSLLGYHWVKLWRVACSAPRHPCFLAYGNRRSNVFRRTDSCGGFAQYLVVCSGVTDSRLKTWTNMAITIYTIYITKHTSLVLRDKDVWYTIKFILSYLILCECYPRDPF